MTLETIDGDTGSNVTTGTKVFAAVYPGNLAVFAGRGVAIDAFGKAGLFRANALMYGLIAFVQEHFHVSAAHFIKWRYTGFTLGLRHYITLIVAVRTNIISRKRLTA